MVQDLLNAVLAEVEVAFLCKVYMASSGFVVVFVMEQVRQFAPYVVEVVKSLLTHQIIAITQVVAAIIIILVRQAAIIPTVLLKLLYNDENVHFVIMAEK